MMDNISFYVVVNEKGHYYIKEGRWTDDITKAKVWPTITKPRSVVTFFANRYRDKYPVLKILKLNVASTEEINETERVNKAYEKRQKRIQEKELRESKRRLKQAEQDVKIAQEKLQKEQEKLKGK